MALTLVTADDGFDAYMDKVLTNETGGRGNGYVNDPMDHGGETVWGVTAARARAAGYAGAMCDMPKQTAIGIYRLFFWQQPMFDQINGIMPKLAFLMLDHGINSGPSVPGKWLQRALNVLNGGGVDFPDLTTDGVCGAMTRQALRGLFARRGIEGGRVLLCIMSAFAGVRYVELAEHDPTQERFEFGWLSQRAFPAQ